MKQNLTTLKIASLLFLYVLFSEVSFAQQSSSQQLLDESPKVQTIHELSKNFNDKWEKYNVDNGYYFENGKKTKAPGWKIFKREEWYWEQRVNIKTGEFPQTNAATEYAKLEKSVKKTDYTESWTNLGTNSSTGGYSGIGRINCIEFHPTDANTFWVGSPAGGIWKTTDGGSSWTVLNDDMPVLGVSDIGLPHDFNGTTNNTIYIATGDRDGGSLWSLGGGQGSDNVSVGVYKSTDGGTTWNPTSLTFFKGFGNKVTKLLMHPTNSLIIYASTLFGIYKTIDGGTIWSKINFDKIIDMEFKPGDPNTIYASTTGYYSTTWNRYDSYVVKSTDAGATWSTMRTYFDARRVELAVTPADNSLLYALVCNGSGGLEGIFKSTSGGFLSKVNSLSTGNMLGYYSDGSGSSSGQGTYDLCIAVSPTNADEVYIGGINTWKSTDGGSTWINNNMWTSGVTYNKGTPQSPVVHADKHALEFQPGTNNLFEGNDGGIYKTADGGSTWQDLTNGMVISQLYRIGVSQTNSNIVLTGLQDNGSKLFNTGVWSDVKGGDGMECIVDYSNSNYMYATYVRGQITRSDLAFPSFGHGVNISSNIPGGQPTGAWVTPYIIDPNNSSTLFAGFNKVWKTTNRGDSWTSASDQLSGSNKLRSLAIAPSNSLVLYTADQTNMWKTTDGGVTSAWTSITLPALSHSITYIAVHPTDPNTLWFTVGGYTTEQKVYESTDGGSTWSSISTGLPNLPIMSIVHYKKATDRNVLFVGTDLGVYVKDGTNDWAEYNSGLPSVVVSELEIYYAPSGSDKLRAGTFGRGLWETGIDAALPVELSSFSISTTKDDNVSLKWETETEVNNYGFEIERKIQVSSIENQDKNQSWQMVGFVEGHGNSNSPKFYKYLDKTVNFGKYNYRLKQIDIDGSFEYSDIVEADLGLPTKFSLSQNYPNPFNPTTTISYNIPTLEANENFRSVQLNIYDVLGNEVSSLVNKQQPAGNYKVQFDASKLSSGVYYYQLKSGSFVKTKKMMLMK
ncbi:MAG: T9SS type A sorting domain-containing protein [Melioribacteraceae bacterium]